MSGVLNRFKGESDFQLTTDARKLRGELMNWLNNPKHVPKRFRWIYVPKISEQLDRMVEELKAAQPYPHDEETLKSRREHIANAMKADLDIWNTLQSLYDTLQSCGGMNLESIETQIDTLYNLYPQMKAWKRAGLPKK